MVLVGGRRLTCSDQMHFRILAIGVIFGNGEDGLENVNQAEQHSNPRSESENAHLIFELILEDVNRIMELSRDHRDSKGLAEHWLDVRTLFSEGSWVSYPLSRLVKRSFLFAN